jgi:hypothetical protein
VMCAASSGVSLVVPIVTFGVEAWRGLAPIVLGVGGSRVAVMSTGSQRGGTDLESLAAEALIYGFPLVFDVQQVTRFISRDWRVAGRKSPPRARVLLRS